MKAVCPQGHELELADPNTGVPQLVGVVDCVEQFAPVEHADIVVRCSAEVVRANPDNSTFRDVCGEVFTVEVAQ